MLLLSMLPLFGHFTTAAPGVLNRSLAAADIDELRAKGLNEVMPYE